MHNTSSRIGLKDNGFLPTSGGPSFGRIGGFLAISMLLCGAQASAANHYVRQGAAGNGSGSDWANACTDFTGACAPSSLVRGDTYYVADGAYAARAFNTPTSGTLRITIKKATEADHGTSTGWNNSYGDGQAVFNGQINVATPYWTLDGQTRSTPTSGHGLKVTSKTAGILLNGSSNVVIRYVEVQGAGPDGNGPDNDLIRGNSGYVVNNVLIQYCHLHDAGRTLILTRQGSGWTVEHSILARNESVPEEHAEAWSIGRLSNVTLRYNRFESTQGTGILATLDNDPGPDGWEIYGNVFLNCLSNNAAITTDSDSSWTNVKVYNNTFVNGTGHNQGIRVHKGSGSTWQVYNNIWYNNRNVTFTAPDRLPHDYNWFYASGAQSEPNIQIGAGNPFVNLEAGDLRLATPTQPGMALSTFSVDMHGNTRGSDGVWDRGAYEFQSTAQVITAPPSVTATVR